MAVGVAEGVGGVDCEQWGVGVMVGLVFLPTVETMTHLERLQTLRDNVELALVC